MGRVKTLTERIDKRVKKIFGQRIEARKEEQRRRDRAHALHVNEVMKAVNKNKRVP